MVKLSSSDELAVTPADGDFLSILDVSDISQGPTGTRKKIRYDNLVSGGGGGGGLANVVEDLTPQLGGDLDGQSTHDLNNIVNAEFEGYVDVGEISTPANPAANTSRLYAADEGGFTVLHVDDSSGIDIEVGRDTLHVVRNTTGSTLSKGALVYINGATGTIPTVALASASAPATADVLGMVVANITNNSNGQVIQQGDLGGLNTSSFVDGDSLYLSTVAGTMTTTSPTGSNLSVHIGTVIKGNSGGGGIIKVNVGAVNDPTLTQTLTNKTLTSPKINENVAVTATATELNYVDGVTSAIQGQIDGKQATLVSGTNIKTVNGNSILGAGDLVVSGGGGGTVYSSHTLTLFQGTNELIENTSGSYTINTYGVYGLGTYMNTAGGAGVRQEIYRPIYNSISMSRVKSFYAFAYIYGDVNTGLSHKTFVGMGVPGTGNAATDIDENANNIGFIVDTALDGFLKIYALNGNGTSSTKTQIYSRDVVTLDGGGPTITPVLTFSNDGSEIKFYMDGVLGATHTTNIPTGDVSRVWTWLAQKPAGLAAKWLSVDIFESSYTLG